MTMTRQHVGRTADRQARLPTATARGVPALRKRDARSSGAEYHLSYK